MIKPFFINSNICVDEQNIKNFDLLFNNIAGNIGNSYITYSLIKEIYGDLTHINHIPNIYSYDFDNAQKDIDFINNACTHVFLILQDQIRISESYGLKLPYQKITNFIKQINKPIIIAGLGANIFNSTVNDFIKQLDSELIKFLHFLADHSIDIGVRGEITQDILNSFGINNTTIIGCPSFYEMGADRVLLRKEHKNKEKILYTSPMFSDKENHIILQDYLEQDFIKALAFDYINPLMSEDNLDLLYSNKLHFFSDIQSWKNYIKNFDFSIGYRVHGSIISINSGVPAICCNSDSRAKEMCKYMHIPYFPQIEPNTDIIELYDQIDTDEINNNYKKIYSVFEDFMKRNNIEIFKQETKIEKKDVIKQPILELKKFNPNIKDRLQIVLITYNRKEFLKDTLETILAENSPIREFDITIINNYSTDGTTELLDGYASIYKNITHIINPINIGGNANIAKALAEYSNKEYIWVLCDNDTYNWSSWDDVICAMKKDYDVIVTRKCQNNISDLFHEASFLPACIYKTKNITSTIIENMYDNIHNMFPHLAIMAKNLNDNNKIFIVNNDIVEVGVNPNYATTYTRGMEEKDIPLSRKMNFWSVGFFNSLELIKDRKKQIEIIDGLKHYHKNLFELFISAVIYNKIYRNSYFQNLKTIYKYLNFNQKLKFILAIFVVYLSCKDYTYWFIRYKDEWIEYFEKINQQQFIKQTVKKLKNKKVILYGAGMVANLLLTNYDLSKINIIGISDKKFETSDETEFRGIKIIKPSDLKNTQADMLLFTMKTYKNLAKNLQKSGVKMQMGSLVKQDNKYVIRT